MLKRIFAFVTVLFMGLVLTVRSPVKADTFSIPFSAVPDLLNAFYTVAAGGKIEFSSLIGSITGIDDFFENLSDYYDKHYTQPLLQSTQGLINIGLSGLAIDGIDSIDGINNLTIPITPQDIANFMGYDINWFNNYADSNSITISPDASYYQNLLDNINGRNYNINQFWWYNYSDFFDPGGGYSYSALTYPYTSFSWFSKGNNYTISNGLNTDMIFAIPCNPLSIYITNSNGVYSYSVSVNALNNVVVNNWNNVYNPGFIFYFSNPRFQGLDPGTTYNQPFTTSYSGSIGQVLQDISTKFKNVSIYVDGDLWSFAGDIPASGITLNDYIDVGDTGNITYGVYPITSTGDIGLDLAKWGEYIYNQCISGIDSLSMDTVIEDGWEIIDTEDGERAITQDDEEDVAKVIHGFVGTTATTPSPTPDIGDPPVLKIIPPILDLPDEIWPDGGRDTTVLAQMVHATDVAIPDDIMTIIWSTIGLLVVGGLISILHK